MHFKFFLISFLLLCSNYLFANIFDVLFPNRQKFNEYSNQHFTITELRKILPDLEVPLESKLDSTGIYSPWAVHNSIIFAIKKDLLPENQKYFFKFDINADGRLDIIYNGDVGPPEPMVIIWENIGKKYRFVAAYSGYIESIFYPNESNIPYFIIESDICCGNYVSEIFVLRTVIKNNNFSFEIMERYKNFNALEFPEKLKMIKPIEFITVKEKYRLRYSPSIVDTLDRSLSDFMDQDVFGNIIAVFKKGSKGKAIASTIDETGRIWWFVIMSVNSKTSYNLFYNDKGAHKCGWMSSKYLKIIK